MNIIMEAIHSLPSLRSQVQQREVRTIRRRLDQERRLLIPDYIKINVGGREFNIRGEMVQTQHLPDEMTRLDRLIRAQTIAEKEEVCHFYDEHTDVFYFLGLSVTLFEAILNFQWNGYLHLPRHLCMSQLLDELQYWQVSTSVVLVCCSGANMAMYSAADVTPDEPMHSHDPQHPQNLAPTFHDLNHHSSEGDPDNTHHLLDNSFFSAPKMEPKHVSMFEGVPFEKQRRDAWMFLEDYTSSIAAKVFAIISVSVAFASIFIMIIGSIPDYQELDPKTGNKEPMAVLQHLELACVIWFTIEYLTRLIITPNRGIYVKEPMQIVDILTIVPSYLEKILQEFGDPTNLGSIRGAFLALRLLRVLRVARVFRLARYHTGLKQLGETLRISKREFSVLAVFFTTTVLLFSTSVYYLEKDVEGSPFISIPAACWWCVITITTVGYGDVVPMTVGGQIVATCACLAGIIVLAFPITMIIENFNLKFREDIEEREGRTLSPLKTPIRRIKF